MSERTDQQLLREYAGTRSEEAFAELVRRYLDFVYSAVVRMVRDKHLAEDVTQAVFLAVAKDARQLADRQVLAGWLHRTAQNLAANAVRSDVRRRAREQEAVAMNELLSTEPGVAWEHIAPHLDDALGKLDEADRDALFLRYFQHKSLREVGATLGVSDDAAQKRVTRAVERLREFFAKRGVKVGSGAFVGVITANAVQAAPAGLAITISTAAGALAGAAVTTTAITTLTTMSMINAKTAAAILLTAVLAGTATYFVQKREADRLRHENQGLLAQHASLASERDAAASAAMRNTVDIEQVQKDRNELLRLRSEVGLLRQQTNSLASLREGNRQLRNRPAVSNAPAVTETATPVGGELVAKESWVFAGFANPESAFQSMLWSSLQGNVETFFTCFSPEARAHLEKLMEGKSESEIAALIARDSDVAKVTGYRIVSKEITAPNKMTLTVYQEGRNRTKKANLTRFGNEWKLSD